MAQYAVLIYAEDSAHAPEATAEDIEECDRHADELLAAESMLAAYALTPREHATSVRAAGVTHGATDPDEAVRIARTNPVVHAVGGSTRPPRT